MTRISKTHRRDVVIGDWAKDPAEFHVRIWADTWDDGQTGWVDFEIFEVIGHDGTHENPGPKFFNKRDSRTSPNPAYSYDDAEVIAEGFVKFDGCTQFNMGHVHVDSREQLEMLFKAIEKARELAADEMPGMMIGDEYP